MGTPIDEETPQSDLVHERLRESPVKRWLLLDGSRFVLVALVSAVVFSVCVAIGFAGYIPVTDPATATTLVGSIVGGTLPFITIVLAINQLVLSQEMGWPSDLQDRFDGMVSFRREVETVTGSSISPASPADFLQSIVSAVADQAETLQSAVEPLDDPELSSSIGELVGAIEDEGEQVNEALEGADLGTFEALSAVLGHFNGAHLYAVRMIREKHDDVLSDDVVERFETLIELLGHLAVARQTFKTMYMQHELAYLSKLLLYVGFPTLLGGGIFMMTYGRIIETLPTPGLVFVVSAAVTLVFLPFVVLLAYTLRIATITSRTADFGPFVPRVDIEE
ncbi:hypothetical protein [Halalkalicoccus tibetensis]|uniref:Flagellar protein FlaJ n=1 Tax=Halalkalicoccus tibetensis TaxID=175632 RepID=A0ABD5UYW7_9EURY